MNEISAEDVSFIIYLITGVIYDTLLNSFNNKLEKPGRQLIESPVTSRIAYLGVLSRFFRLLRSLSLERR
jgi:hypothetical protein